MNRLKKQETTAVFQGCGEKKSTCLWATQDWVQSDDHGADRSDFLDDDVLTGLQRNPPTDGRNRASLGMFETSFESL